MAREREIVAKAGETYTVKDKNGVSQTLTVPEGMERERVEVKDKESVKEHFFNTFVDHVAWMKFLAGASVEAVEEAFNKWSYAHSVYERASVREAAAAESTVIRVDKKDVDLMLLPVKSACLAINGAYAIQAATVTKENPNGKEPQAAFIVARRKLIESNKAKDSNGQLVALV